MASAFLTIEKASKIKDPFAFAPYVLSGIYRTRNESDGLRIEILMERSQWHECPTSLEQGYGRSSQRYNKTSILQKSS
jgi:hypothetical protein